MSNISGVNGGGPVSLPASGIEPGALTAETLLFYCASNLRALDVEIETRMKEQQGAAAANKALTALRRSLTPYEAGGIGAGDVFAKEAFLRKFKEAYDAAPASARAAIQAQFDTFRRTACHNDKDPPHISLATYSDENRNADLKQSLVVEKDGDVAKNSVGKEEVAWMTKSLDDASMALTKDAELTMISLQAMISQRQMAVQLTTNMLNKLNETAMAVASKVGG